MAASVAEAYPGSPAKSATIFTDAQLALLKYARPARIRNGVRMNLPENFMNPNIEQGADSTPLPSRTIVFRPIPRSSDKSTLGKLEILPPELLLQVFGHCDIKTVTNLSRTCLKANAMATSLLPMRDLIEHATPALWQLSQTEALRHISAFQLHRSLTTTWCSGCGRDADDLFFLTGERVCNSCNENTLTFRLITPTMAKKIFRLSDAQMGELVHTNRVFNDWRETARSMPENVKHVSLRAGLRLAISVYGSEDAWLKDPRPRRKRPGHEVYQEIRHILLGRRKPRQYVQKRLEERGLATCRTITFPYVSPDRHREEALVCTGCQLLVRGRLEGNALLQNFFPGRNLAKLVEYPPSSVPTYADDDDDDDIRDRILAIYFRDDFIDHAKYCPGVRYLQRHDQIDG